MTLAGYASLALVAGGLFFTLVATVGILRLPDLYTRAHATSKADTLGVVLTLAGVGIVLETGVSQAKLAFLLLFMLFTNPTAAHAITRAAFDQGIEPWSREDDGGEEA